MEWSTLSGNNRLLFSRTIDFFQAWHNFVKPHKSLINHIWTLKELLTDTSNRHYIQRLFFISHINYLFYFIIMESSDHNSPEIQ